MKKKNAKSARSRTPQRAGKKAPATKKSARDASAAKASRKTAPRKRAAATHKATAKKAAAKRKRAAPSPRVQKKRAMRNFLSVLEEKQQRNSQTPAWQEIEHHDHSAPPPRKS